MTDILYIHGMGGGGDSRIPSMLNDWLRANRPDVRVIVRTYSFDPELATEQIESWYQEIRPSMVIGESMGANHALALLSRHSREGKAAFELLLVSPALGGPHYMHRCAFLTRIPGMKRLFERIYKPREGDRQAIVFEHDSLRRWPPVIRQAEAAVQYSRHIHAFFGYHDHYRKNGIVSIGAWRRMFGAESITMYDGTHFMEEQYIHKLLIPTILAGIR